MRVYDGLRSAVKQRRRPQTGIDIQTLRLEFGCQPAIQQYDSVFTQRRVEQCQGYSWLL